MALSKVYPPYQAVLDCDLCESQISVDWHCKTCPANLCQNCKKLHTTRRNFREHKVIPRSHLHQDTGGDNGKIDKGKCRTHPNHDISLICKSCGVEVCTECIVTTHNGHKFENMDARLKRSQESLRRYLQELESQESDLANEIQHIGKNLTEFNKGEENLIRRVAAARELHMKKIDAEYRGMVNEIQRYSQDETKEIKTTNLSFKMKHDQIKALIKEVRVKISLESYEDLERYRKDCPLPSMFELIHESRAFALELEDYNVSDQPLIGKILHKKNKIDVKAQIPRVQILTSFTSCEPHAAARRVRPISPNEAWVCFYKNTQKLALYHKSGREVDNISLSFVPQNFIVNDKHEILICDLMNKCIMKVTPAKDIVLMRSTAPYQPYSIFINRNNEPVICLGKSVAVFTQDFKSHIRIMEKNEKGDILFRNAVAVTENGKSYTVVDRGSHKVINIDLNGDVEWTYAPNHAFDPAEIVNYNKQMLIVSNCRCKEHELHFITVKGELLTIYESGLLYPESLAISSDGVLWVTESCESKKINLISIS